MPETKMSNDNKKQQFIELRAKGISYQKISQQLSVPKTTLIRWSRDLAVDISNYRAIEIEALCEEYLIARRHRIKAMATQLNQITQEIIKRDLTDVSTIRLFEIQAALDKDLRSETTDLTLTCKEPQTPTEKIKDEFTKIKTWHG